VNWVDIVVVSLITFSAMMAFVRGFVRELLGIGSWIGAGFFAVWAFPFVRERFRGWIEEPDIADAAAFGSLFVGSLFVFSIVAGMISRVVRSAGLGGIDRTFGIVFGMIRGAGALVIAYIVVGMAVPLDRWPEAVQEARVLPLIYQGAVYAVLLMPDDYRPVVHVPPGARETKAADLLRVIPQGRAVAKP